MNIYFDNTLHSITKHAFTSLSFNILVQVIDKPTHYCGHIIDWVVVRLDDCIHIKSTVTYSIESEHYCTKSNLNVSVYKPSTTYRTDNNMSNISRTLFIVELSNASEFSSVEKAIQYCDVLHNVLERHANPSLR